VVSGKALPGRYLFVPLNDSGLQNPNCRYQLIDIGYFHNADALRESEYNRGTGCGKTARPGLCGGRWVTGVPTVRWRKGKIMKKVFISAGLLLIFLSGCANPINQVTSDNYAITCSEAERAGRLDIAEQACYRALMNVDMGNLGDVQKSEELYNLGRIKRKLNKVVEAEDLFKQSLEIEEKISTNPYPKIGRRLAELAMLYGQKGEISKGVPVIERLLPVAGSFTGAEKETLSMLYYGYAQELKKTNQNELSTKYEKVAIDLGFKQ